MRYLHYFCATSAAAVQLVAGGRLDTLQTVLVISQLVPGHQRLPGEETEHLQHELDTSAHVQSGSWQQAAGTCCS